MSAWVKHPRLVGRPQHTLRHLHIDTLWLVLGDEVIAQWDGRFANWIPMTKVPEDWNLLALTWLANRQRETYRLHGDHELLGTPLEN